MRCNEYLLAILHGPLPGGGKKSSACRFGCKMSVRFIKEEYVYRRVYHGAYTLNHWRNPLPSDITSLLFTLCAS